MGTLLDFESYEPSKLPMRGSTLLSALQNKETVPADLFIRESIQNSLDAAIDFNKPAGSATPVIVSIRIERETPDLAKLFPEFGTNLPPTGKMLEIRDSGTEGLTGPVQQLHGKEGNFSKLVYDISKPQDKQEAGGSWGLGKTVYFRMGIGLVLYYSRIRIEENQYQERFAACFVEDEQKKDRRLPDASHGIAWWGRCHTEGIKDTGGVIDQSTIKKILGLLGIQGFTGTETGTSVIIPYLSEALLPRETGDDDNESSLSSIDWFSGIEGYLDAAIQKWYCVRLGNQQFRTGPALKALINGKNVTNTYPCFKLMQEMYNATGENRIVPEHDIKVETIKIRGKSLEGDSVCGKVVTCFADQQIMKRLPPDNRRSPFEYIFCQKEEATNPALCAYIRKPGMITNWGDPEWTKKMPEQPKGEYLFILFVLQSDHELKNEMKQKTGAETLERYIRSTEKSDHARWIDIAGVQIVERIKMNVIRKVSEMYAPKERCNSATRNNTGLKRFLAKRLLPAGIGRDPREYISPHRMESEGIQHRNTEIVEIIGTENSVPGTILVGFSIGSERSFDTMIKLSLLAGTEGKSVEKKKWESIPELGKFPCQIESCALTRDEIPPSGKKISRDELFTHHKYYKDNYTIISAEPSGEARLDVSAGMKFLGIINIKCDDKLIQPALKIEYSSPAEMDK